MTVHRLLLTVSQRELARLMESDFLWRPLPASSSFRTNISPGADELSGANRRNVEFLRLAAFAYLVDRTTPRPSGGWTRKLELEIPVWEPEPWNDVAVDLGRIMGFLTSDEWALRFHAARTPRTTTKGRVPGASLVALFSGGADSLCGAILEGGESARLHLVSHWDSSVVAGGQNEIARHLARLWGHEPQRTVIHVGRAARQIGSGRPFLQESSSRSRSLLFLASGLTVASVSTAKLLIPENGFASLNPPLGAERRGSLSTRTTHPWFLWRLSDLLRGIGAHSEILNPFAGATKGEMFKRLAVSVGHTKASEILSSSNSCGRGDLRFAAVPGATHCGVCFGCLVRRAAFKASGLDDRTSYAVSSLEERPGGWLTPARRRDLEAVRYATKRGVDEAALLSDPLPPDLGPRAAVDLARRGMTELGVLFK